ncbi:MAG: cysteine peptidase family C39 domain-containing protein [Aestuariivita sp.]|nr:cysteine peptidase family C39 domain-containing protein [Aestuariivita sp.]MCY4202057.1 cysteine peptidase family C39 domain-containing protein [Aestuariivita sp.]MCY4287467.1 cysteine peptidase family C39 domain-containing protein [Aestuariivita sp.]MCY4346454.1 cysteine peptidase family C39 domain-containing protein [Aestuariivita sp.]
MKLLRRLGLTLPSNGKSNAPKPRLEKTPLVLQMCSTECGAACIGIILAFYGRWVSLNDLRAVCGVSRDGSDAAGLKRAANHYGLDFSARSVLPRHLYTMPLPMVIFWEWNHFLVLEGFDKKRAFLNDPAFGRRTVGLDEFEKSFSGIAMEMKPTENFRPEGERPNIQSRLPLWLAGSGTTLAYLLACTLLLALTLLALPVSLGLFVDVVVQSEQSWATAMSLSLFGLAGLVYLLSWLRQRCLTRLSVSMSTVVGNQCVSQLLKLPLHYFSLRLTGDLTDRITSIDTIGRGLQKHLIESTLDLVVGAVFFIALFLYDELIAAAVGGLTVFNLGIAWAIHRVRGDDEHTLRREQGMLIGLGMLILHRSHDLRMTASDEGFFSQWSGQHARELSARQKVRQINQLSQALNLFLTAIIHVAVLGIGALQIIADNLTLGALAAIYLIMGVFLASIQKFLFLTESRQTLASELQRLDDILDAEIDERFVGRAQTSAAAVTMNGRLRLSGHVSLRNVTFGYDRGRKPLIKDFNLTIKPGQRVAIVGSSGSGKSTLAALVSGAFKPWTGELLFDHQLRENIPVEVLGRSISLVNQQPTIFAGSIRDNITLWNSSIPDEALITAARDACIHDQISARPEGYATIVDEEGGNFSGGECQRLEIARALVGNPSVLILDEATSALDAETEQAVDDSLRRRGVSTLIIAHRISTIRDCDQIVVLDQARVVQQGMHQELIQDTSGLYHQLVRTSQ